jgi:hypothetical protein
MKDKAQQTEEDARILAEDLKKLEALPKWIHEITARLAYHDGCSRFGVADSLTLSVKQHEARVEICELDGKPAISINGLIAQVEDFRLLRDWLSDGHDVQYAKQSVDVS